MTEHLIFCIHRNQLRALRETIEAWMARNQRTMVTSEVEDLATYCLHYSKALTQLRDSSMELVRSGEFLALEGSIHLLQELFEGAIELFRDIRQWTRRFEDAGHHLQGMTGLETAIAHLQELNDRFIPDVRSIVERDIEEAHAEHARGECMDLDDVFAAAAGYDKETWLKRVEEQRQARK